jgi:hypothetical protein
MLPPNTLLQGRYEIIQQIGRGGMGAVYKATDIRLRSTVALKQTLVEGEALRRAFEREAQLLAGLRHPTLPRVSDHFIEGDGQFLVMEFIPGDDLGALIAQHGPYAPDEVLRWADQLLDALEYLHTRKPSIIHRDIKPQNLKLTDRGEIILLDFGLAKGAAAQTRVTSTGSIFGYTPHYAPLEQVQGTGTDPRSDLYSLAATMYHLLTGTPPVDTLTRASARINEEPEPLPPLGALAPTLLAPVADVLNGALSLRADQRPPSAAAMRSALRDAAHGTAPLVPPFSSSGLETIVAPPPSAATTHLPNATQQLGPSTTVQPGGTIPPAPVIGPPAARRRPAWLLPAILGAVLLAAVVAGITFASRGDQAQGATTPTTAAAAASPTEATAAATGTPAPTLDILKAAAATYTAQALFEQDVVSRVDKTRTSVAVQTAVVLAATATGEAQLALSALPAAETPALAASDTAVIAAAPRPSNTPRPQRPSATPGAPRPSATPQPPTVAPAGGGNGAVLDGGGSGELFTGSGSKGDPVAPPVEGGSCIQGRVTDSNGGSFQSFYVQVDNRGRTIPAKSTDPTNYRICGLGAGEWGVAVYAVNNTPTSDNERVRHQVRVRLSGTPGEIFYVNFRGRAEAPPPPTEPPPPLPPTATPQPQAGTYDGEWAGTLSGQTTTGDFRGSFRMTVRGNAVYYIGLDGPSCFFGTYPNYPQGAPINGDSFGTRGSPFNPETGLRDSISYVITGQFSSPSSASGRLEASENGGPCANATWSVTKR